jgi:phage recombination protein Bet
MTTTAIQIAEPGAIAAREFGDKIAIIRSVIAPGTTPEELDLFATYCQRTALDPFAKQIYAIKRAAREQVNGQWRDVQRMTIQVGIDGARLIAERTGMYAGQLGPYWYDAEAREWLDVWLEKYPPAAAKVGVLRHDFKEPLWGVARFDSYASKKNDGTLINLWARMPEVMIAKCAESLALRKAFPQQMAGLLTGEEMQQADNPPPAPIRHTPPRVVESYSDGLGNNSGDVGNNSNRQHFGATQHYVPEGQAETVVPPKQGKPPLRARVNGNDFRAKAAQADGAKINEDRFHAREAEPPVVDEDGVIIEPPGAEDGDIEQAEYFDPAVNFITENTRKRLYAIAGTNSWSDKDLHAVIGERYKGAIDQKTGKPSVRALSEKEATELCDYLDLGTADGK